MKRKYVRFQIDPIQNFWSKVEKTENCWNWIAGTDSGGYGIFGAGQTRGIVRAHRYSWEITNGKIPELLTIDHRCENRKCVNVSHMELVTRSLNGSRVHDKNATSESIKNRNNKIFSLKNSGLKTKEISEIVGVSRQTVRAIVYGRRCIGQ